MRDYKIISDNTVKRLDVAVYIPEDDENADWQEYQEWLAEGNTPLPADPPLVPGPDPSVELDAALNLLESTGATVDQLIAALRGQSGKLGRVAGRLV